MIEVDQDLFKFDPHSPHPYRRLSIRECARVQTFPDNFIFYDRNLASAYKMIGNAVPVNFSSIIAKAIARDLFSIEAGVQEEIREMGKVGETGGNTVRLTKLCVETSRTKALAACSRGSRGRGK